MLCSVLVGQKGVESTHSHIDGVLGQGAQSVSVLATIVSVDLSERASASHAQRAAMPQCCQYRKDEEGRKGGKEKVCGAYDGILRFNVLKGLSPLLPFR